MKPLVYKKSRKKKQETVYREKMPITKGDHVRVVRGNERGAEGTVLHVYPKTGRVVVEGVNIVKRHRAARQQDEEGGIIEFPAPIHHSNVMLLDPKSGDPTRIRRKKDKEGAVERLSVKSGRPISRNL